MIGKLGRVVLIGVAVLVGPASGCKREAPPSASRVSAPSAAEPETPVLMLPEFVLENERGESVGLQDLHGTVWVADFVSTRCEEPCTSLTRKMTELMHEVERKDLKFLSVSVDPVFDRPDILRAYMKRAGGAELERWTFLTGPTSAVRALVRDGFKLPSGDSLDGAMAGAYSENFALIDRAGRVRGAWGALDPVGLKDVRAAIDRVLDEKVSDRYVPYDLAKPDWMAQRRALQLASGPTLTTPHDFQFTDRLGASGITFRHVSSVDVGKEYRAIHYDHGTAVAVADVDLDGRPDLFFVNQIGKNALYKNLGGGRFEDITESAGVGVGDRACVGASFADVDNDGAPDLLVTSVRDGNLLFHNDGHGRFTDITERAGLGGTHTHSSGAVFFDYDGDGWLDLFVANVGVYTTANRQVGAPYEGLRDAFSGHLHAERSERSVLYHNRGGGQFDDVTVPSGLTHTGWSGDAAAFDYDGDGKLDLYVLSMQGHDALWHNLGGGHFESVGARVFPMTPWGSMGVKVFDWNGDGRLDLFVTDMHTDMATPLEPGDDKKKHDPSTMFPLRFLGTDGKHVLGNALFTNEGSGKFKEMSDAANVETGWPWGPSAGDLNADGWPDLFITSGMNYPFRYEGNSVLLNERGQRFADAEFLVGVEPRSRLVRPWYEVDCDGEDKARKECRPEPEEDAPGDDAALASAEGGSVAVPGKVTVWAARASRSSAIVDLDGDGDLDIVTNEYNDVPQILISNLAEKRAVHFLNVRLEGTRSNRDGLGSLVTVEAKGRSQLQVQDGKSGYLAESQLPLYFGLGEADHADSIKVKWPTGKEQILRGPIRSGALVVVKER
jgi:cytochrome oxidase Cu insertion factor (SCO1/SenC/PrrC family)